MGWKLTGPESQIQIQLSINEILLRQSQPIRVRKACFIDEKAVAQGDIVETHQGVTQKVSVQNMQFQEGHLYPDLFIYLLIGKMWS